MVFVVGYPILSVFKSVGCLDNWATYGLKQNLRNILKAKGFSSLMLCKKFNWKTINNIFGLTERASK